MINFRTLQVCNIWIRLFWKCMNNNKHDVWYLLWILFQDNFEALKDCKNKFCTPRSQHHFPTCCVSVDCHPHWLHLSLPSTVLQVWPKWHCWDFYPSIDPQHLGLPPFTSWFDEDVMHLHFWMSWGLTAFVGNNRYMLILQYFDWITESPPAWT